MIWFVLIHSILLAGICFSQDVPEDKKCPFCKTTGRLSNPFYEKYMNSLDLDKILFSSWVIENDPKGLGLPWYPCERCRNETLKAQAEAEFERLAAARQRWLAQRREIDKKLQAQEPLLHLETEHFLWTWDIPELTYNKRKYRSHEALNLYAMRIEGFYNDFKREHKITDEDLQQANKVTDGDLSTKKFNLFCFERELIARKACPLYGKQASPSGRVTLQGVPSVSVKWWDKTRMPTEDYLYRDMVHSVAHLLVAVYHSPWWLFESGFAYEGLAHWWELYYSDKATSTCIREINILTDWVASKWEQKVKKAVLAGKCPSLVSLLGKNGGSLSAKEHIFSWSIMDYMMFLDKRKTLDFCVILKQNRPAREAFYEVWGASILNFEAQWREYVKQEYKVLIGNNIVSTRRTRSKMRGALVSEEEEEEKEE
ncbi:MAG: hypothetical protein ABIK28_19650 [Planctomycetota bacterium]